MQSHRIRLTDQEVELIVSALNARVAMTKGQRRSDMLRLAERLADGGRGNPDWRFGPTDAPGVQATGSGK